MEVKKTVKAKTTFEKVDIIQLEQDQEPKHIPPIDIPPTKLEINVSKKVKTKPRQAGTPYGLKGFFIDKNGNVKLMLDRKCCAKSITLEPTFLAQISGLATNILEG